MELKCVIHRHVRGSEKYTIFLEFFFACRSLLQITLTNPYLVKIGVGVCQSKHIFESHSVEYNFQFKALIKFFCSYFPFFFVFSLCTSIETEKCTSIQKKPHDIQQTQTNMEKHYRNVGETVLVIGAGPSGMDLANEVSKVAERVSLSHHQNPKPKTVFAQNVDMRPDVERLTPNGAVFVDGTEQTYSTILYCTGYKYTFPFLSIDCGISVDDNYVQPLYKHCININHPTMALIGVPYIVCASQMFDLQVNLFRLIHTHTHTLIFHRHSHAHIQGLNDSIQCG